MKVLNITEDGRYAGPQGRIIAVAPVLRDIGIETTVICPLEDSELLTQKLSKLNIPCISTHLHHITRKIPQLVQYLLFFIPEVFLLMKIIKSDQFEVVHCNGCWQIKGVLAGKLVGVKTVWHLNDTYTPQLIKKIFSVVSHYCADGFIVAGQRVKDYYLNQPYLQRKLIMEIQAPVDTQKFNPRISDADQMISSLSGVKIVTIGNIGPYKGLETFIQMCVFLNEALIGDMNFIVVGPIYESQIKYGDKLKKMKEELNVENLNFIGKSGNIVGVLKAADIYVCSSRYEASPTSVWEAMSMAKPVVSTDVGDVAKFFEKANCGFVVPVGDVKALAEKVAILIENENLRKVMGNRGRNFAKKNLDVSICVQKHDIFYKSIVNSAT